MHRGITTLSAAALLALASVSASAAVVSFSTTSPADADDAASITGTTDPNTNVQGGNDAGTYVADDRPVVGQTFTTGANPTGYLLTAVSYQQVTYSTFTDFGAETFNVRVTRPAAQDQLTVLHAETAASTGQEENRFPPAGPGAGTGNYITFTLTAPVTLAANTQYGFDVGAGTRTYFEVNGTNSDAYAGGGAYVSALGPNDTGNGTGDLTMIGRTGDHVFVASLTPLPVPEPASMGGLLALGGAALLRRRRRA